jgi:dTDP-4-amino-4,6-dideoxygalactose transaminase
MDTQDVVRLSRSIVGARESEAVARVILEDGYLGMGREVQAFEVELASFLGIPSTRIACVSSGTAALHLSIAAALQPGDEVLVPSLTYVASYQAIVAGNAVPVSCDVCEATATLNLADAESRLSSRTRAIMPVHYASNPAGLGKVHDFAQANALRVIEDAAHAFGCTADGRLIGSFGDITCFSFDGIKNITSGEGGAVVSEDEIVMSRVRDARLLGVKNDTDKRLAGSRSWEFDVSRAGYRYHMSNLFAAIGRTQLDRFSEEFAPKRVELGRLYRERLRGVPGIVLLHTELGEVVPHIQPVRVTGGRRDAVRDALDAEGIQTGLHYKPNHLLTLFGAGDPPLPVCEQLYGELLSLPLHPALPPDDVERTCATIVDTLSQDGIS